jgi:hypothetical protein
VAVASPSPRYLRGGGRCGCCALRHTRVPMTGGSSGGHVGPCSSDSLVSPTPGWHPVAVSEMRQPLTAIGLLPGWGLGVCIRRCCMPPILRGLVTALWRERVADMVADTGKVQCHLFQADACLGVWAAWPTLRPTGRPSLFFTPCPGHPGLWSAGPGQLLVL